MADSYAMMYRASQSASWGLDAFQAAYNGNREECLALGVDACPIAEHVVKFLKRENYQFIGTSAALWESFKGFLADSSIVIFAHDVYPKGARGLTDMLKRYAPALEQLGVSFTPAKKQKIDGKSVQLLKLSLVKPASEDGYKVYDVCGVPVRCRI